MDAKQLLHRLGHGATFTLAVQTTDADPVRRPQRRVLGQLCDGSVRHRDHIDFIPLSRIHTINPAIGASDDFMRSVGYHHWLRTVSAD